MSVCIVWLLIFHFFPKSGIKTQEPSYKDTVHVIYTKLLKIIIKSKLIVKFIWYTVVVE